MQLLSEHSVRARRGGKDCPDLTFLPHSLLLWLLPTAGTRSAQNTQGKSPGLLFFLGLREKVQDNQHKESSRDSWSVVKKRSAIWEISSEGINGLTPWWMISACLPGTPVMPINEMHMVLTRIELTAQGERQSDRPTWVCDRVWPHIRDQGEDLLGGPRVKHSPANAGDTGLSLVWKDATCCRATEPISAATEPLSAAPGARAPEPMLHTREATAVRSPPTTAKSSPYSLQLEKASVQQRTLRAAKNERTNVKRERGRDWEELLGGSYA